MPRRTSAHELVAAAHFTGDFSLMRSLPPNYYDRYYGMGSRPTVVASASGEDDETEDDTTPRYGTLWLTTLLDKAPAKK